MRPVSLHKHRYDLAPEEQHSWLYRFAQRIKYKIAMLTSEVRKTSYLSRHITIGYDTHSASIICDTAVRAVYMSVERRSLLSVALLYIELYAKDCCGHCHIGTVQAVPRSVNILISLTKTYRTNQVSVDLTCSHWT